MERLAATHWGKSTAIVEGPDFSRAANPQIRFRPRREPRTAYFMDNHHPSELPSRKSAPLLPSPGNPANSVQRWFLAMNPNVQIRTIGHLLVLAVMVCSLISFASAEWKEKVLYSFQGGTNDGSVPAGGVVFDKQGNLYGATTGGGPASCAPVGSECGTVFELSPGAKGKWTETVIYRFQGEASQDGSVPNGGLIIDAAGNLYGVTAYGGTGDCFLVGRQSRMRDSIRSVAAEPQRRSVDGNHSVQLSDFKAGLPAEWGLGL